MHFQEWLSAFDREHIIYQEGHSCPFFSMTERKCPCSFGSAFLGRRFRTGLLPERSEAHGGNSDKFGLFLPAFFPGSDHSSGKEPGTDTQSQNCQRKLRRRMQVSVTESCVLQNQGIQDDHTDGSVALGDQSSGNIEIFHLKKIRFVSLLTAPDWKDQVHREAAEISSAFRKIVSSRIRL